MINNEINTFNNILGISLILENSRDIFISSEYIDFIYLNNVLSNRKYIKNKDTGLFSLSNKSKVLDFTLSLDINILKTRDLEISKQLPTNVSERDFVQFNNPDLVLIGELENSTINNFYVYYGEDNLEIHKYKDLNDFNIDYSTNGINKDNKGNRLYLEKCYVLTSNEYYTFNPYQKYIVDANRIFISIRKENRA